MAEQTTTQPEIVLFTANLLREGRVAWLAADGAWVTAITEARRFDAVSRPAGEALARAAEAAQQVVGAYAVPVAPESGQPVRFREQLRAAGPSVSPFDAPLVAAAA
jgi:hypothetical protein